ncbi:MAG: hypothetical protein WCH31_10045 [Actinomycetes bacterium]
MKNLQKKMIRGIVLGLGILAVSAAAAFAADSPAPTTTTTPGAGAPAAKGPANGKPGPKFTCDGAKTRLANVQDHESKIQERIASGHVKDAATAAARIQKAQSVAAQIQGRITKRC